MMRHGWKMLPIALAILAGCGHDRELLGDPAPEPRYSETQFDDYSEGTVAPEDTLEMFSDLRFFGGWYELYPYGWVWRPVVVAEWAPMTRGHWVWTSYGWMWLSYDPFGEMTYNYGFWTYDFALGWVWVPDTIWAPVRCDWVLHDDYISWCPMPPPQVRYKDPWDNFDVNPWITVPATKFKDTEVSQYRLPAKFKSATSHRYTRRSPPEPSAIERGTGKPITVTDVRLEQPAGGSTLITRVVLPPEEQAIIDQYRSAPSQFKAPPMGPPKPAKGDGNDNDNDGPKERPATKKEEPSKFKERAAEKKTESKKDGGKSKDK